MRSRTEIRLSTCSIPKPRSKKVPPIWVLMWLPAGFLTSVNSHVWYQLGKQLKLWPQQKLQTHPVAEAHGLLVTHLPCDWMSMMTEFKRKFGKHISDDRLPSQSTFKHFSEKLAEGTLKAEPLSHVISLFEEEQQELKKPEPARQYNLPLVSRLTITAKRRHITKKAYGLNTRSLPASGFWPRCVSQGGQFTKTWRKLLLETSWILYLKRTTSIFYKEGDGRPLISPCWSFCLSYEFERRREAIRLCKAVIRYSGCTSRTRSIVRSIGFNLWLFQILEHLRTSRSCRK